MHCLVECVEDLRCSKCRTARYCSRPCQLKHWPVHKNSCTNANKTDSFDKLYAKAHNHSESGNYGKAENLLIKLLKQAKERNCSIGDMSNVYNDLSIAMMRQGKYTESEAQLRACLEQVKQSKLGSSSREYLATALNLANALNYQGILIIIFHNHQLSYYNHFKGKYQDAEIILRTTLDQQKRILGDLNYETLCTMKTLGISLQGMGRYSQAEIVFKECYEKQIRVLGSNNHETLQTLMSLATSVNHQDGRDLEAEVLFKSALEKLTQVCGENHPLTMKALTNLAVVYTTQEKFQLAESSLKNAIAKQRIVLGDLHPDVGQSMCALANAYSIQDKIVEAEKLFRECLVIQKVLGENHPHVITTKINYSVLLMKTGRIQEYKALLDSIKK